MATHAISDTTDPRSYPPWLVTAGFIMLCEAAGLVGAGLTDPAFYRALNTPSWAPPPWLFGPVWIALYAMMGFAAARVWRSSPGVRRRNALIWFGVQLALNAAWTPVFFGLHAIGPAMVVIAALWIAIAGTTIAFSRVSKPAALLLVPYLGWVTFAAALNARLWSLN
jgi:tryptophan-rich sensory protein